MILSKGLYFALAAALNFSLMALCTKASGLPPQQVIFARSILNLAVSYLVLKHQQIFILGKPENRLTLIMRGLIGYLALSLYFYSLQGLPISVASLIQYMSPVFSGIAAFALIKETTSIKEWFCLILGLIGIGFVSHVLPFGHLDTNIKPIYWIYCLVSSALSGLAYAFVRKLSLKGEDPEVTIFYFPLLSLPLSLAFGLSEWIIPNIFQWFMLLIVGITSYLGQIFLTFSLKLEKTVAATNMLYFGALFATIWGIIFFAEKISWEFLLGALLIIGSQIIFKK